MFIVHRYFFDFVPITGATTTGIRCHGSRDGEQSHYRSEGASLSAPQAATPHSLWSGRYRHHGKRIVHISRLDKHPLFLYLWNDTTERLLDTFHSSTSSDGARANLHYRRDPVPRPGQYPAVPEQDLARSGHQYRQSVRSHRQLDSHHGPRQSLRETCAQTHSVGSVFRFIQWCFQHYVDIFTSIKYKKILMYFFRRNASDADRIREQSHMQSVHFPVR
jgi:hypothetical protein